MKIYDCFSYLDEDLLLKLRLNILDDYVDYFVIIEGNKTWQNNKKELKFNIDKFEQFKKKIIYIPVTDMPDGDNPYKRENFQRNAISRGTEKADKDDLIIISDLDEIPNPDKILEFSDKDKYICFVQNNYLFKFNLLNITEPFWYGTRMCRKKDLKSPQWLREIKARKLPFYKFYKPKFDRFVVNGGWHFSSVKDAEGIYKKLNCYSEQQFNNEIYKNLDFIEKKIFEKKDLFNRSYEYKVVRIDKTFPNFIFNNQETLKNLIYDEKNV